MPCGRSACDQDDATMIRRLGYRTCFPRATGDRDRPAPDHGRDEKAGAHQTPACMPGSHAGLADS